MLYCEARSRARRTEEGKYVPLSEQDVRRWSEPMLREAEQYLESAARFNDIKRFQLEAAIQSAHAQRALTGVTNWEAVALLHEGLVRIAPTIGALVSRAAAVAEARDTATAWTLLEDIPGKAVKNYQPYWALAAYLLGRMQRFEEAAAAYSRAIGLCEDQATREFLMQQAASYRN
jgi:RNA polymerase sigma-70 factor (ECF subfamily)